MKISHQLRWPVSQTNCTGKSCTRRSGISDYFGMLHTMENPDENEENTLPLCCQVYNNVLFKTTGLCIHFLQKNIFSRCLGLLRGFTIHRDVPLKPYGSSRESCLTLMYLQNVYLFFQTSRAAHSLYTML